VISICAGANLECIVTNGFGQFFGYKAIDLRGCRRFGFECCNETVGFGAALGFYFDSESARGVEGNSGQLKTVCEPLDKGPEANSLNDALQ
jgi:hypothetical protein